MFRNFVNRTLWRIWRPSSLGESAPPRSQSLFSLAESNSGGRECSWKPGLLNHSDLDKSLPWGFVEQTRVLRDAMPRLWQQLCEDTRDRSKGRTDDTSAVMSSPAVKPSGVNGTPEERLEDLRLWVQRKSSGARVGADYFQLAGTSHSDFTEGAKAAYRFVSDLWNDDRPMHREVVESIAAPALAELLCQAHQSCRETRGGRPRLVIQRNQAIVASVLKVETEEGRAHKPGQILGRWDKDDFYLQLLLGAAGPEAQLIQERENRKRSLATGSDPFAHLPHRLVAHIQFLVREKYECEKDVSGDKEAFSGEGEEPKSNDDKTFPMQCHIWEFETDAGVSFHSGQDVKLQWRVRNINGALKPRAGRVLKSDGLVERRFGRWMY